MPDGKVGHAELRIGDSPIMLGSPCEESAFGSPRGGHTSVGIHLYVDDVDRQYKQAIDAGGSAISEPKDQFYGDRSGTLKDPFGHVWFLATHKEDLTEAQVRQRAEEMFKQGGDSAANTSQIVGAGLCGSGLARECGVSDTDILTDPSHSPASQLPQLIFVDPQPCYTLHEHPLHAFTLAPNAV